ncbi:MAG: hypothetical protein QGG53_23915 [Planctomycetota bacterium]|nr:hypothetical protein [Planctomycetota bacterium]
MNENNRIEIKAGGGCLMLFGLPFFSAGVLVIVLGLMGKVNSSSGGPAPLYFVIPFGLVFASVGGVLMFGRSGKIIDGDNRLLTSWWGLLVPLKRTDYSFDGFQMVCVRKEVRRSENSSYTCYPVRIESADDSVTVEEPRVYHDARQRGEEVSKLMGLPMEDSTTGESVVREAEHLDESLRDRMQRTGEKLEIPDQPDGCRVTCHPEGDALVLDLPPPGTGIIHYLMLGGSLIGVIVVCVFFLPNFASAPPPMNYVFMGFIGVFFILLPFLTVARKMNREAMRRDRVTVSAHGLTVEQKFFIGSRTLELPSDELEELKVELLENQQQPEFIVAMGRHITARSDKVTVVFGNGLSRDDLSWMYQLLKYVLVTQ